MAEEFREIKTCLKGDMQTVLFDVKHAFIPQINIRTNYNKLTKAEFVKEFELVGWHYGNLENFEKAGFLKIIKKVVKKDCIYVEFVWSYGNTLIKKSFYPISWSKEKVLYNIKEAVKNPYKIIFKGDPECCLEKKLFSKVDDGIEMITYLKRNSVDEKWCIKSPFINSEWILS